MTIKVHAAWQGNYSALANSTFNLFNQKVKQVFSLVFIFKMFFQADASAAMNLFCFFKNSTTFLAGPHMIYFKRGPLIAP